MKSRALITNECGKTFEEAKAEMRRAIENVEVACGMPMMSKGEIVRRYRSRDRRDHAAPAGGRVCHDRAVQFPGDDPLLVSAVCACCGNTYIVKPSEKVPMTMQFILQLIDQLGLPKGVMNLVNGAKEAVDAILDHPAIRAVTFVGSTNVASISMPGRGERQAGPGPGRGEEPGHCAAGRGHGHGDQDHCRFRLWLRGPALPGRLVCYHSGRSA